MSSSQIINNLESRIKYLKSKFHPELGDHPHISGLQEAIRLIKSMKETKNIDPYLQTR